MITLLTLLLIVAFVEFLLLGGARDSEKFYRGMWERERDHNEKLLEKFCGIPATSREVNWSDDTIDL
jgi:hypothetical protein